jgi:hypothetical protein
MAGFRYILARSAIIEEYYEIEADSESEALEIAMEGDLGDPVRTEFQDWRDDEFSVVGQECLDPLYVMVKEYHKE